VAWGTAALLLAPTGLVGTGAGPTGLALAFAWLFAVVLWSALRVAHHAEGLAEALGEPYGTLVLTLSVTFMEVTMIAAVMLHGENNPTLARDTMFAVTMIVLNGIVGLALLMGALRHHEQQYNLQGAGAYLSVVTPLAVLTLVLPNFTTTTAGPTLSPLQGAVLAVLAIGLYGVFLAIQTSRHPSYFVPPTPEPPSVATAAEGRGEGHGAPPLPRLLQAFLLVAYLAAVLILAEELAVPLDFALETLGLPGALGGLVIATLILTPEALGALRAALADEIQRAVNIALGSVLATIALTVPAVLTVSLVTRHVVQLGLRSADITLLAVTLVVSVTTFASGRTNVLQGSVHLLLFLAYLLLLFEP
jgi:Ca2+:H+ antiporter